MKDIFFEYPELLYLEFILVPMLLLYLYREFYGRKPFLYVSSVEPFRGGTSLFANITRHSFSEYWQLL